ncbi:MAG: TolC family protein [Lentisphaeria bacterium]|nr:TolC family protein [Lentisphaeria bacterium]
MKKSNRVACLSAIVLGIAVGGCKTAEDYRNERAEYTVKHFEKAQLRELEQGRVYTLTDCIRIALEHNLDLKVFQLEEAVARENRTAEMLGMLPELNVNNTLTDRDNTPGSSSRKIQDDGMTYGASTSQDRTVNYFNVDLALSVLDFGLAWFNTQQANDRHLMREYYTERASQNLTLDVVRAYFQVAAAQRSINITTGLLEQCRNRYDLIEKLADAKIITPFRAYDETRRFVDMEKRLTNYIRSYENACVELRSLLGYYPNANIKVDDSVLEKLPEIDLPEIATMEQIAMLQRPELYESDINKHINVIECRKTILMMFPNVRIFLDFTNSNNSFLYHQSWWEIGIRAAYNLLKTPQMIYRYRAYSAQVDSQELQTYAKAIGIMAQVRMAHANILESRERFDINDRVYNIYNRNLQNSLKNQKVTGGLSQLELDHIRLATAETEVDSIFARSNYYISYYRMLNVLGVRNLGAEEVATLKAEIDAARIRAEKELAEQEEEARLEAEKLRRQEEAAAAAEAAAEAAIETEAAPAESQTTAPEETPAEPAPAV